MLPPFCEENFILFHKKQAMYTDAIVLHSFGLFTTALISPNCQKCLFLQNQEMNINVDIMLHKEEGDIRISPHQVSNN